MINAWDFTTEGLCRAAIDICLVFYVGGKVFLYLFLVERAHQLVATKMVRHRDWVYIIGILVVLFGFGVLAVFAFIKPVTNLSAVDGKCRIGLPLVITIPLLTYDIIINFILTGIFYLRGARLISTRNFRHILHCIAMALPFRRVPGLRDPVRACEFFMGRSALGAMAIILPTIANLVILFVLNGHENGWLCFTICTIDSKLSSPLPSPFPFTLRLIFFQGLSTGSCYSAYTFYSYLERHHHPLAHLHQRRSRRRSHARSHRR